MTVTRFNRTLGKYNTMRIISKNSINIIDVLNDLRNNALRKRLWYKILNNEERILVNMVYKYVKIVKNATLATVIARIISKLFNGLSSSLKRVIKNGLETARIWINSANSHGWNVNDWLDSDVIRWFGLFKLSSYIMR